MKTSKMITSFVLTAIIFSSVFSFSAFAVGENKEEASAATSSVSAVSAARNTAEEKATENTSEAATDNAEEINYSFSENTIGNSNLVASQQVITDDGQYQFIAVKTRDGDIFYVIIDHSKVDDNVYFLNEVDTYDLKALLNKNDEGKAAQVGAETSVEETTEDESEALAETEQSDNDSFNGTLFLIIGIGALAIIGFVIFKIKKGGFGKKKANVELLDDDFDDEDEINEDGE